MKFTIAKRKKFFIILTFLLIFMVSTAFGFNLYYDLHNPEELFEQKINDEEIDVNNQFDKSKVNILIYGLDRNEYREEVAQYDVYRSDTIMVATLDFEENTMDLVSIPRDTYVDIYNQDQKDKINSCFMYASLDAAEGEDPMELGVKYLSNTVSSLLGDIPINYYVGIKDMDVVTEIVDEIGGVEVDVLHDLYADKGKDRSKIQVEKGYQRLDGKDLQYYARYRTYPLGDIDRVANQQHIMKALLSNAKKTNTLVKAPQIYNIVQENLDTNLTTKQMTALALFGSKLNGMETHTLPGDFGEVVGVSYWIVNQEDRVELIKDIYGITVELMAQDNTGVLLTSLDISVGNTNIQVGQGTNLSIYGTTNSGVRHNFDIKDTNYSVNKNGIVQLNEDNTVVGRSPGTVTVSVNLDEIYASVIINVREVSQKIPESEPIRELESKPVPEEKPKQEPPQPEKSEPPVSSKQSEDPDDTGSIDPKEVEETENI